MSKLTEVPLRVRAMLLVQAYLLLIRFDYYIATADLEGLRASVHRKRAAHTRRDQLSIGRIIWAMDLASVFYCKQVLCLQRAAATTCLMRKSGIGAELVLGAQMVPFKAHAWVEIDGEVVGERSDLPASIAVLDRC
jgi:hypothetical protein